MPFLILLFSLFYFSTSAIAQSSSPQESDSPEIRYISDDLFIFMHAGPSRNFRILGSITAGSTVSLLQIDNEAGYAKVQDERERTGWVESKFVSPEPSLRVVLENVNEELSANKELVRSLQEKANKAINKLAESEQQKKSLNQNLTRIFALNTELEKQVAESAQREEMEWFTRGALLALASIFIGFLVGMFARKKNKSNPLM